MGAIGTSRRGPSQAPGIHVDPRHRRFGAGSENLTRALCMASRFSDTEIYPQLNGVGGHRSRRTLTYRQDVAASVLGKRRTSREPAATPTWWVETDLNCHRLCGAFTAPWARQCPAYPNRVGPIFLPGRTLSPVSIGDQPDIRRCGILFPDYAPSVTAILIWLRAVGSHHAFRGYEPQ